MGIAVSKIAGYIIWLLIILLSISVVRNVAKAREIRSEIAKEQAKVDKVKAENAALQKQIQETQNAAFIEKEVRDKLGLVKEGEAIVILPDEDTLKKLAPVTPTEENILPDPIWQRWLKLFL